MFLGGLLNCFCDAHQQMGSAMMNMTFSLTDPCYGGSGKASTHPVQTINWYDCVKWCNVRSEKEGRVPAYYTDAGLSVRYRSDEVAPYVNWGSGYRLPTEAEWEKAARGGASGQRFPWGNTISWSQANYWAWPFSAGGPYAYDVSPGTGYDPTFNDGVNPYTSPVGYFAANAYGLYDMAGNVFQRCWDWYGRRPILADPHRALIVWFAAALGTATRWTAGRRSAPTSPRRTTSTASGSDPSCPQVSELKGQSGAGVAE